MKTIRSQVDLECKSGKSIVLSDLMDFQPIVQGVLCRCYIELQGSGLCSLTLCECTQADPCTQYTL